jgi:hypothetical protein
LIVEEYAPTIKYVKGITNSIADFLSRYPRLSSDPPTEELHLLDVNDALFPLDFALIHQEQQQDNRLLTLSKASPDYTTTFFSRLPIIHYKNKIVIPSSLQERVIRWHHESLCHPGIDRTLRTISAHFHWNNLSKDVHRFCANCAICQQYKKSTKHYGLLPTKKHNPIPWSTVCVDLIGPWSIPSTHKKRRGNPAPLELLVFTVQDPATNWIELQVLPNKSSSTVARTFDRTWLCRYPRPLKCVHDSGTEFTGVEFQELLTSYGIRSSCITVQNPQGNSILERAHQTIGNQLRSLVLQDADLSTLDDLQANLLDPVKWALNSTFHSTLLATPGQLTFGRDMILPVSYLANWEQIRLRRQHRTDVDTARENRSRIAQEYQLGDLVLVTSTSLAGKLARPTSGPFPIVDVSTLHVNGTVTIRRSPSVTELINIRRLRPYRAVEDANAVLPVPP